MASKINITAGLKTKEETYKANRYLCWQHQKSVKSKSIKFKSLIKLNGFFFGLFLILGTHASGIIVFDKANSPYSLTENFILNASDTLIIEAGVTILLAEDVDMILHGSAFVLGSEDEPVYFSPLNENSGWGRIDVSGVEIEFEMNHAVIKNGTFHFVDTHVKLHKVAFFNDQDLPWNGAIVRIIKGSANIQKCMLKGSYKGEGFLIHESEEAIIKDCHFEAISDAVEFISMKNSLIRNNIFVDLKDDAIDLNHSENILVDSNYISHIEDRGFEIGSETFGSSKNIQLVRNIIVDCDEGITFKEGSTGNIVNCTLFENRIGVTCIEDIPGFGGSEVMIENTIFSNSLEMDIDKDDLSTTNISFSLSDKEWLTGNNNYFGDPAFVNPSQGDYRLMEDSPCINTGNPETPLDPDNTIADMGALYRDKNTHIVQNHDPLNRLKVYPNPFTDNLYIDIELSRRTKVIVSVFNSYGLKVESFKEKEYSAGEKTIHFSRKQTRNWPTGNLILSITADEKNTFFKLIKNTK